MDDEVPLADLGFWPPAVRAQLEARWIVSAEQVVAIAATQDGMAALADLTGLPVPDLAGLIARTRAALPPAIREEMSKPADTRSFGTGALPPKPPRNQ